MPTTPLYGPRAGFWRRLLAFTIDCVLIGAVVTIVGPSAFSMSGGWIQIGGVGINSVSCVGTTTVPANLDPPPVEGSNHAQICAEGSLPFVVSKRFLRVGRRTVSPGRVVDVNRDYPLSTSGVPIPATDLTWVFQIGFLVYIATSLMAVGRTVGMRVTRIRLVVPSSDAAQIRVPLSRLLVRVGAAVAGLVPCAAALIWILLAPDRAPVMVLVLVAFGTWLCWTGVNVVLIARKQDPIYDRVAGVAVIVEHRTFETELPLADAALA